jgi:gluconate 2-dehydrogenase alpha chain
VPQHANRIDLDPSVRDVYGRAVARVTWTRHPHDQAVVDTYMPKLEAIVRASGADTVLRIDPYMRDGEQQTKHLMGTTRMGTDPRASVCDPNGRMHDLENVWIADGGLFPTSTAQNPTLTQQALAWRTAAFMAGRTSP